MIKKDTALKMAAKALVDSSKRYSANANMYLKEPWRFDEKSIEYKHNIQYKKYMDAIKWMQNLAAQPELL